MKELAKKVLPKGIVKKIQKSRSNDRLFELRDWDYSRFVKYSYALGEENSIENLRAKMTFFYHSLEKGLSNANLRYGFGERAFTELFKTMDLFIEKGYDTNDSRFQQALSVVKSYVDLHEKNSQDYPEIVKQNYDKVEKYKDSTIYNNGGFGIYDYKNSTKYSEMNFTEFMHNRHSVRDFGEAQISRDDVRKAIDLAKWSPSACNRQSFKVYYVKDEEKVGEIIKIQRGLTHNAKNIRGALVITNRVEYYNKEYERNLSYVDGGMFSMSLMLALNNYNIANCPLSAAFAMDQEKAMRELLGISPRENLTVVLAIGSFPDEFKYAKSQRDSLDNFVIEI
ncbi:nitroreductase family protein [Helcococcus kunzii]|uniref:nitroreductase family protein n=1 Tax=Helcococcus kunzii TaxID=40091 RepID=UPI001BB04D3D|nr:nitroreductase family protein [Helcococcus kunzii]QUY64033.1 nitroreductase family protein [Helcococcus kunzii]